MRELAPATLPSHLETVLRAHIAYEKLDQGADLRSVAGGLFSLGTVGGN